MTIPKVHQRTTGSRRPSEAEARLFLELIGSEVGRQVDGRGGYR